MCSFLCLVQILGLHDGTHSHDDEFHNEDKEYLWKILCLIAGIYGFFLIEKVFSYLVPSHAHVSFFFPIFLKLLTLKKTNSST